MKKIPALVAHAMKVDVQCKKASRRLGQKAFKLKAEANDETSAEKRRIKEVLANQLNEHAGQLRYNPTSLKDMVNMQDLTKSDAEMFSEAALRKGLRVTGTEGDFVEVGGNRLLVGSSEFDPVVKGWDFIFDEDIAKADFVVLLCRSFGDVERDYIIPIEFLKKSISFRHDNPHVAEVFVPMYDADWMEFRDRL